MSKTALWFRYSIVYSEKGAGFAGFFRPRKCSCCSGLGSSHIKTTQTNDVTWPDQQAEETTLNSRDMNREMNKVNTEGLTKSWILSQLNGTNMMIIIKYFCESSEGDWTFHCPNQRTNIPSFGVKTLWTWTKSRQQPCPTFGNFYLWVAKTELKFLTTK